MPAVIALSCIAALIGIAVVAVALARWSFASRIVYGASLAGCLIALAGALMHLVGPADASMLTLPLGLPGLGAHFRVDALAALFLAVVDFGAAMASLYALGYGQHEPSPLRVLPFFP